MIYNLCSADFAALYPPCIQVKSPLKRPEHQTGRADFRARRR